jgi:triacylglycerol esterase/lipase EstA (alpha/beta hydrolase family)
VRYEAAEPALVRGGQLFEICYRELIEELRHNLTDKQDEPVSVFPFSYDWRQPLQTAAQDLAQLVDEVIARTKLQRHYDHAGYGANPKVNLVGHSMGGLVILTYLRQQARKPKSRRSQHWRPHSAAPSKA